MRVIAGTARGRPLVAPRGTSTRPIADRVKETLFAILGEQVVDAHVLDLYAGSGAVGIEALSRGAAHCDFVEHDRRVLDKRAIRQIAIDVQRDYVSAAGTKHPAILRMLPGGAPEIDGCPGDKGALTLLHFRRWYMGNGDHGLNSFVGFRSFDHQPQHLFALI